MNPELRFSQVHTPNNTVGETCDDNSFFLPFSQPDNYNYGAVNCSTPDVTAGYYNVSIYLKDRALGYGNAMSTSYLYRAKGSMLKVLSIAMGPRGLTRASGSQV